MEKVSAIKYDVLSVEAADKIHATLDLLIKNNNSEGYYTPTIKIKNYSISSAATLVTVASSPLKNLPALAIAIAVSAGTISSMLSIESKR